jgi:hypothetical protein
LAAHASAAPAPTLFHLSIVGTAHQQWTYTAAPVADGNCTRTETSEGIRTVTFRTKPVLVELLGGRVRSADVGGLSGTVTLDGANTTDQTCGVDRTQRVADCAQTRRSFAGGKVRVSSPRPGGLAVGQISGPGLTSAACPREPVNVSLRPFGPALKSLRLPRAELMNHRFSRVTLSASATQRTIYGSPESGNLQERTTFKLTFSRASS